MRIVSISYNDLVEQKQETLLTATEEAFGPQGLGIIVIRDVPEFAVLRQRVLEEAAKLGELGKTNHFTNVLDDCISPESNYSTGWSHGKEQLTQGVPDTSKGSFYANPLVPNLLEAVLQRDDFKDIHEEKLRKQANDNPSFFAPNVFPRACPELEPALTSMGKLIHHVGCLVARACQDYCREKHELSIPLHSIVAESLNCKARLLHYYDEPKNGNNWWCGWHKDHGALTGLVPCMYRKDGKEIKLEEPSLYIQTRNGENIGVSWPADCLAFQLGETFQILTNGLLEATPHAVKRVEEGCTREALAVFLQPEFDFPLTANYTEEILSSTVRPLKQRYRPGCTFGEFHNATVQAFQAK
ncbi:hypothetical protein FisN_1Lh042 [Fistulifera solaris]|uniref:Isopenicillin N synthase-like Fe(2+) 2OG dioxygenase domain-containing protein n=1 Tax=Fistulifera solaris TaxID=1519565 RepID=A0A1Z5JC95_FISSO|nr:hypothetical protein FisN_1Lh042 [Fistulifera solaris]|eukprot:GAX11595.1 hypothetical protein FisN_1Lh042 [Fistulifera solaris]